MMNTKGQTFGITLISAIFVFIIGMIMLNFLMPSITQFRVDANCANPSAITDGTKLLCLATDTVIPYWIVLIFSVVIGSITARMYL